MNEHIRKGNVALASGDLQTAEYEFGLVEYDNNQTVRRIAQNRLRKIRSEQTTAKGINSKYEPTNTKHYSFLSDLGYKVGKEGKSRTERRNILRDAFCQTFLKESRWGKPSSSERYEKLCNWLRFRINSNSNKPVMDDAVADWNEDLKWLEVEFKKEIIDE